MRLLPRDFFALLRADCLVIRGEPRFDAHAAHERVLLDLWVHLKFRVDKRLMCLVAGESFCKLLFESVLDCGEYFVRVRCL